MSETAKILTDSEAKAFSANSMRDGLENLVANLGTDKDKRSFSKFVNNKQLSLSGSRDEVSAMYRTDWLAGKIVDIIPDDMTREWRTFSGDIKPETVRALEDEEDRLNLQGMFNLAHKWARLYGTAFIVIAADDGLPPNVPLDINAIKPGSLKHIKAIDRWRVNLHKVPPVADPLDADYGMPQFYRMVETGVEIHRSRLLRFDGVRLPYDDFRRNNYFSDSILARLYDPLTNFSTAANSAASMLYESNVDVIKIEGLLGYLQTPEGEDLIRKRFGLSKLLKSFNNMLLLDNKEDFETKSANFSGVALMMDRLGSHVVGSSDVPATKLMGAAASGLNATGEGDQKNYYDTVRSRQMSEYKPNLDYFDIIMAKNLGLPDDADLDYKFNSLFQLTEEEVSKTNLANAQRDQIYIDRNIVTELAIAKELKQKGTYTNITEEELDELGNVDLESELESLHAISTSTPSPNPEETSEIGQGQAG